MPRPAKTPKGPAVEPNIWATPNTLGSQEDTPTLVRQLPQRLKEASFRDSFQIYLC